MIVVHKESPAYIIISNQNTMTAAAFQSRIPMYVCMYVIYVQILFDFPQKYINISIYKKITSF